MVVSGIERAAHEKIGDTLVSQRCIETGKRAAVQRCIYGSARCALRLQDSSA